MLTKLFIHSFFGAASLKATQRKSLDIRLLIRVGEVDRKANLISPLIDATERLVQVANWIPLISAMDRWFVERSSARFLALPALLLRDIANHLKIPRNLPLSNSVSEQLLSPKHTSLLKF